MAANRNLWKPLLFVATICIVANFSLFYTEFGAYYKQATQLNENLKQQLLKAKQDYDEVVNNMNKLSRERLRLNKTSTELKRKLRDHVSERKSKLSDIAIFTFPYSMEGYSGAIQRQAFRSWLMIYPLVDITFFGDATGVKEYGEANHIRHISFSSLEQINPTTGKKYPLPLLRSAFSRLLDEVPHAKHFAFVAPDMILNTNFTMIVHEVAKWLPKYLLTGLPIVDKDLRHPPEEIGQIDADPQYFIFPRKLYNHLPELVANYTYGLGYWMIRKAFEHSAETVDGSQGIAAARSIAVQEDGKRISLTLQWSPEHAALRKHNFEILNEDLRLFLSPQIMEQNGPAWIRNEYKKTGIRDLSWKIKFAPEYNSYLIHTSREYARIHSLKVLEKLKHLGERCVIIGNGPSLNKMDLSFLKNETTFASNKIYLGLKRFDFAPTYYASVNHIVLKQSVNPIIKLPCYRFIPFDRFPHYLAGIINMDTSTASEFGGLKSTGLVIHEGWTVTYALMQIAYLLGCKDVFLIGVDHNFIQEGKPNEKVVMKGDDPNHFDPNYFGNMEWNKADLTKSEYFYNVAKKKYESEGRNIYDATVDGKCTVFPKVDYKTVFFN